MPEIIWSKEISKEYIKGKKVSERNPKERLELIRRIITELFIIPNLNDGIGDLKNISVDLRKILAITLEKYKKNSLLDKTILKKTIFGKCVFREIRIGSKLIKQYLLEVTNQGTELVELDIDKVGKNFEINRKQIISFPIEILKISETNLGRFYTVKVDIEIITGNPGEINLKIRKKIKIKPFTQKYGYRLRDYVTMVLHTLEKNL